MIVSSRPWSAGMVQWLSDRLPISFFSFSFFGAENGKFFFFFFQFQPNFAKIYCKIKRLHCSTNKMFFITICGHRIEFNTKMMNPFLGLAFGIFSCSQLWISYQFFHTANDLFDEMPDRSQMSLSVMACGLQSNDILLLNN
jgi:hypothetical protein